MKRLIICVHGLRNKPPKKIYEDWWKLAISEGLDNYPPHKLHLKMAYWADLNYFLPLSENITDPDDPLFLKFPYVPKSKKTPKVNSNFRKKLLHKFEFELDKVLLHEKGFIGFDTIEDFTMKKFFKDLYVYYHEPCLQYPKKQALTEFRGRLAKLLRRYRFHKILLVGHSMGSIIAYDTLTQVVPNIKIDTLVTLGSPLGLPAILKKILHEQGKRFDKKVKLITPENIKNHWYNLSDLEDEVCVNYDLGDDFKENSRGIKPIDLIVKNDYSFRGERNPHKIYGYLRTAEFAKIVRKFLNL